MASQNEETTEEKSHRHLSWFERLYQKFESVCTEVDNSPSSFVKGTAKYVENQANLVGSNVRRLYTEFMQDLLDLNNSTPEVSIMSEPERIATCSMETTTTTKPRQEETEGMCLIMEPQADNNVVDTTFHSEKLESISGHRSIGTEVQNQIELWDAREEEIPIAQEETVKASTDAVDRLLRQRKSKSTAVLIPDDIGEEQGVGDDTEPDWDII